MDDGLRGVFRDEGVAPTDSGLAHKIRSISVSLGEPRPFGDGSWTAKVVYLFQRWPKIAVPTRTIVLPSAMAAAMSALMPIDKVSSGKP